MSKRYYYDQEFKEDALNYITTHPELSISQCAKNLGVNVSTLHGWRAKLKSGKEIHRGQGNYKSDEAKEIAKLKRELRDAEDALMILKKTIKIISE